MSIPEALKPSLYGLIHQVGSVELLDALPIETIYKICNFKGFVAIVFSEDNKIILQDIKKELGYKYFDKDFYEVYSEESVPDNEYVWGNTIAEAVLASRMYVGEINYLTYNSRVTPSKTHVMMLVAI